MADKNEITRRWEEGVDHDPRSIEIFKAIAKIDLEVGSDYFCWKYGGDGDNGEHLMFELDIYFASKSPPPDDDRVLYEVTEVDALRDEIAALKTTIAAKNQRINDLTEACIGEMSVDDARLRAAMDESTKELTSKLEEANETIATLKRELAEPAYLDDGEKLNRRVYEAFLASFKDAGERMSGLSHYMDYVQSRWSQNLRIALSGGTNFIQAM